MHPVSRANGNRRTWRMLALALILALVIVPVPTALAASDLYVCPTGDCSHPGSSYNTIQAAINASANGGAAGRPPR